MVSIDRNRPFLHGKDPGKMSYSSNQIVNSYGFGYHRRVQEFCRTLDILPPVSFRLDLFIDRDISTFQKVRSSVRLTDRAKPSILLPASLEGAGRTQGKQTFKIFSVAFSSQSQGANEEEGHDRL
jgi:hypothetical protein